MRNGFRVTAALAIATLVGTLGASPASAALPSAVGTINTVATFTQPVSGLQPDTLGNVYFFQNRQVKKLDTNGVVTTIAGNGSNVVAPDGTNALDTGFVTPQAISIDLLGQVNVFDSVPFDDESGFFAQGYVRKVKPDGTIQSTLLTPQYLSGFADVAADPNGNFYFTNGNATDAIYKFDPSGRRVFVQEICDCSLVAVNDSANQYLFANGGPNIFRRNADGSRTRLTDDDSEFTAGITSLAAGTDGSVYASNGTGDQIRLLTPSGDISVFAGADNPGNLSDGNGGDPLDAHIDNPQNLVTDISGNLYFTDNDGLNIRSIGVDDFTPRPLPPTCNNLPATIVGSDGVDTIAGTSGDDVIVAGDGDDYVNSGPGNDTVCGGDGDDNLEGGSGNDYIYGRAGKDTMFGGGDNDILLGGTESDFIRGGTGNDELHGNGSNDQLYGGAGDDRLYGEERDDTLFGESGSDYLLGGTGGNRLDGGDNNDVCAQAGKSQVNCD